MADAAVATVERLLDEVRVASPAGFATVLHLRFTSPSFVFQSYPKAWMKEYIGRSLHMQDPSVLWSMTNTGWIRWGELEANDPGGIIAEARRVGGMTYGVAWAVVIDDSRSFAGFSRGDRDFNEDEIAELGELLSRLHVATAGSDQFSPEAKAELKALAVRLTHA